MSEVKSMAFFADSTALLLVAGVASNATIANDTAPQLAQGADRSVEIASGEWKLKGDFRPALGAPPRPTVLLLNKANGNRRAYEALANALAQRGINSLRLDLRGHGESINAGRFIPFDNANNDKIFIDEHLDVLQALARLRGNLEVDSSRLGVVGASYSGELAIDAARREGRYLRAYALLSPGSLSEDSARSMDSSGSRWLFVRAAREQSKSVAAAAERVQAYSRTATVRVVDSDKHATDLLAEPLDLNTALADWFEQNLSN